MNTNGTYRSRRSGMESEGIEPNNLNIKRLIAGSMNVTRKIIMRKPAKMSLRTGSIAAGKVIIRMAHMYVAIRSG